VWSMPPCLVSLMSGGPQAGSWASLPSLYGTCMHRPNQGRDDFGSNVTQRRPVLGFLVSVVF
jgi:hypothetical protein